VSTLASRFGNYRCEGKGELLLVQTIIFLGALVTCILGSSLLHLITQRTAIILGLVLSIVGVLLTVLSPSLTIACIGLVINMAAATIQNEVLNSFIPEVTSEGIRTRCMMIMYLFFGLSASLTALVYWLIKPWELAMLVYQFAPNLIALLLMLRYVEETPMELVIYNTPHESLKGFSNIAQFNGVPFNIS
jgi:MFS family permease